MQYLSPELQRQVYQVRRKKTVNTKLDAPYTLLSIHGRASTISVSSEFKEEDTQSHNVDLNTLMPPETSTATATAKSVPALVQKLPTSNDQDQGAQRQKIRDSFQDDRNFAKFRQRTEDQISKLTRKEQRAKKIAATKVQSKTAIRKTKDEMIMAEMAMITMRRPEMSNKAVRKRARKVVDHRFENRMLTQQDLAILMPKPSIDPRDSYETQEAAPEEDDVEHEQENESRSPPDGVEYEDEPPSVSVISEESEGKNPGSPHVGKDGNTFMVRKHATMNPFERLQAIQKIGEIRDRGQAIRGYHGQFHLVLENPLEEERQS